ncbi:MAG TPA: helix-turn-helix domain-containing protein, partial [Luteolibacter sp.]
ISIPDSLSILSRSDDNVCLFASPPISSFRGIGSIIGELALTILIKHLNGDPLPQGEIGLSAPSIIERDSTGVPAGIDPSLRMAVHFIRRNALNGITVDDVLSAASGVSRSQLYRSFNQHFGNTPAEEIQRLRIVEAKSQLRFTRKSLSEISDFCSFKTLAHFSTVFAREVGVPPSRWRADNQFHH